jgi:hypothetical protein
MREAIGDLTLAFVTAAPIDKIKSLRERMGGPTSLFIRCPTSGSLGTTFPVITRQRKPLCRIGNLDTRLRTNYEHCDDYLRA